MSDNIENFILSNYDCKSTSNQGEYRTVCPFCGHADRKCYFYFTIYAFKCYHCEAKGQLRKFFRLLHSGVDGLEYEDKDINVFQEEIYKKAVKLPPDFKAFSKTIETPVAEAYVSYLLNRGISLKTLQNVGIGYSPSLTHYVVVPIRDLLGRQVYYTTILTRRDLKLEKSYNPTIGSNFYGKGDVLFNLQHVARANEVWLTEGPMDALSFVELRLPVVALLGKSLSNSQLRLLKLANFTTINICLDADALDSAIRLADKIKGICKNVNICKLPTGDPNEAFQQNKLSEFIGNLTPFNSRTKLLLKKSLANF